LRIEWQPPAGEGRANDCFDVSSAFPTMAPNMRLRSVPFMAFPGVEEVTNKSPLWTKPFSGLTLHGTVPMISGENLVGAGFGYPLNVQALRFLLKKGGNAVNDLVQ
jgi:hypothetical protein